HRALVLGSSASIFAPMAYVVELSLSRKVANASAVISSLPTEDSISSSDDLIESSEGGSAVSARAPASTAAPKTRNALTMVQRTNCRPNAGRGPIVMSASPPRGGRGAAPRRGTHPGPPHTTPKHLGAASAAAAG